MSTLTLPESMPDSRTRILRLFGPPGTGKTTDLARRVEQTVAQLGPEAIRIASFSVTAAQEIASRRGVGDVLPAGAVGTLHSHAYRAIEHPDVALDPKVLAGWNETVGATWRITGDTRGPRGLESRDRAGAGAALETGDALLEELDLLRAKRVPQAEWSLPVREFAKRWTGWKREVGCVDYTDMIVYAYHRARDGEPMPGNPQVFVVDEAQDLTTIESSLVLEWGRRLSGEHPRLVFALDDDQAINEWRGGDPTAILDLDAADNVVLAQSWRVPPAVHAVAESWISRCSTRYPKDYHARGPVDRDPSPAHSRGWAYPVGYSLNDRDLLDAIEADLNDPDDPDATVMVIASCGYMLTPLIKALRERGLPFHNPFRPSEQAWNPLGKPGRGMSTAERIWRYAVLDERTCGDRARVWTGDDLAAWLPLLDAKLAHLVRGAKSNLEQLPNGTVPWELVAALWRADEAGDEALRRATAGDDDPADHLRWLSEVISPARAKVAGYPLNVARRYGPTALVDTPRVVIGTIHSTKGAQADRVYLAPDLSGAGMRQWRADVAGRDQAVRLFYVGLTRAFQSVRVLASTSDNTVPPRELVPPHLEVRP